MRDSNKRMAGVTHTISLVILIFIVIALGSVAFLFFNQMFKIYEQQVLLSPIIETNECLGVDIRITNACYGDNFISTTIENTGMRTITSDSQVIMKGSLSEVSVPFTPPDFTLKWDEKKTILLPYSKSLGEMEKLTVIPKIEASYGSIFCSDKSVEMTGEKITSC